MPTVYFGAKTETPDQLDSAPDLIAVRTRSGRSMARSVGPVASPMSAELADATLVASYPEAKVQVYRVPLARGGRSVTQRKQALRASPDVRFAGGVLVDPISRDPVLYTENIFIKFVDPADPQACLDTISAAGLSVKQAVDYATNAWFAQAPEGTGQAVFDIALKLLKRSDVEYCHPELIRPRVRKAIHPAQWHLAKTRVGQVDVDASAQVAAAHAVSQGAGVTIAVIDDGFDVDHPQFAQAGKIVAPRDATERIDDPRPKDPFGTGAENGENHGTACAGVACAAGVAGTGGAGSGAVAGASGVAPLARLMPIRMASGLGSMFEAEAFKWAADHGADVISCSWGPPDGPWWDPAHASHRQRYALPASTRLALDYVTTRGRAGKGCVVLFAAGNGNESVDNDGYASYERVLAVAACNDRGRRSIYSDFGAAIWCAFPSNDFGHAPLNQPEPLTPGIWTTDRLGRDGYNAGDAALGDAAGAYTQDFGGTSSACPGAAGVAALVLAVNPALTWQQVKQVMAQACDRIDPAGGAYSAQGRSAWYGHGRINAQRAVALAQPQPRNELVLSHRADAVLPDLATLSFPLQVAEDQPMAGLSVRVDVKHSWIGDLVISLKPPRGVGVREIVLHERAGGNAQELRRSFDATAVPALARLAGQSCKGIWTLVVRDAAAQDSGTLASWGLVIQLRPSAPRAAAAGGAARAAVLTKAKTKVQAGTQSPKKAPTKAPTKLSTKLSMKLPMSSPLKGPKRAAGRLPHRPMGVVSGS